MVSPQHLYKVGKTTLLVHSDEFADGYSNGMLAFAAANQTPLTVDAIRQLLTESILDVQHTDEWNSGYVVGAISIMREGFSPDDFFRGKEVQLGSLLLRLTSWRFREGYANGHRDYEADKDLRAHPTVLADGDLLRYIAHRDPDTGRYFFAEEELSALEETMGQLIGYFCAALFSRQERHTGPLQACARVQQA